MIFTCKCLNIMIKTDSKPMKFDKRSLGADHRSSSFFLRELQICKPDVVIRRQECLIEEIKECGWIAYKCINCNLTSYAESVNKMKLMILLSIDLLNDPKEIEKKQNSYSFSQLYNIYVKWRDNSDEILITHQNAHLPPRLLELQRQLNDHFDEETELATEKINHFTISEYSVLDESKSEAENEFNVMCRNLPEPNHLNAVVNCPTQCETNQTPSGESNNDSHILLPTSNDSEGIFFFDDMDDQKTHYINDDDFSENEGEFISHNNSIDISYNERRATHYISDDDYSDNKEEEGLHNEGELISHNSGIDKRTRTISHPINIPGFIIYNESDPNYGDKSVKIPDYGASIQALKECLHGERVFEDFSESPKQKYRV